MVKQKKSTLVGFKTFLNGDVIFVNCNLIKRQGRTETIKYRDSQIVITICLIFNSRKRNWCASAYINLFHNLLHNLLHTILAVNPACSRITRPLEQEGAPPL